MKKGTFVLVTILTISASNGQKPNIILMNMDDVSIFFHKIQHLLSLGGFGGFKTVRTAPMKTSSRPSFDKDEHSKYFTALIDFRTASI